MNNMVLVKTVMLQASPERVFEFLTKCDLLATWFHKADADLIAGKPYALMSDDHPDKKLCWGEVLEMKAPERVVYTFTHDHLQGHPSTVTFVLEPCAGGTKLTLTHEGLVREGQGDGPQAAMDMLGAHDEGWDEHTARLRKAVMA